MFFDVNRLFVVEGSQGKWHICWQEESTEASYLGGEVHMVAEFDDEPTANRELGLMSEWLMSQ